MQRAQSLASVMASMPAHRVEDDKKADHVLDYKQACKLFITDFVAPILKATPQASPAEWEISFIKWKMTKVPHPKNRDLMDEVRLQFLLFFQEYKEVADGVSVAVDLIRMGQQHSDEPDEILKLTELASKLVQKYPRHNRAPFRGNKGKKGNSKTQKGEAKEDGSS
jgi:hypothetical protein